MVLVGLAPACVAYRPTLRRAANHSGTSNSPLGAILEKMNLKRAERQNKREELIENIQSLGSPAGLKKSHQIIKTELDKEVEFSKLCSRIKLNELTEERSKAQKTERRSKRTKL